VCLDDPAAFVAAEFAAILLPSFLARFLQFSRQQIGIVTSVGITCCGPSRLDNTIAAYKVP
jgi:hypothetical protein